MMRRVLAGAGIRVTRELQGGQALDSLLPPLFLSPKSTNTHLNSRLRCRLR